MPTEDRPEWHVRNWSSERECAYHALIALKNKLPHVDPTNDKTTEWGTIIIRHKKADGLQNRYGYLPLSKSKTANRWNPDECSIEVPAWAERWSYCHTHPDGGYFSTWDTATARGEQGGFFPMVCTMYMLNHKGAYWYDGRLLANIYHGREMSDADKRNPSVYGKFPGFWD